ncbi:L,D-transpeptidase family protein [Methylophilaceae bacterium]|nr:L,D-transpeptidase family protein [Methylophilaceae bacterium]|tara:strand:+ start:682 stop:2001 length:1320 start_codon:yes stop_codon:yes gene_type:complete
MRFFFLIVIFYCSNIISIEKNQSVQQSNFFDKKPAEQRKIFIQKFKNLISQKNTAEEKKEQLKNPTRDIKTVESLLIKSLELISNEQLDQASKIIDELIVLAPNFKLAHLIRGDILTAYSMSINNFGGSAIEINSEKVKELKKEAQRRIKGYLISNKDISLPKFNILPAKKDKYLIYVDMDSSRLFVFQNMNGKYFYMSDHYVSIGKNGYGKRFEGDKKTPFGTYFIQKKIQRQLIDFYGDGAYPLNYPNKFDKINNFTGSGIWIHGTPKSTYSRPPEASDGCIVLSNKDLVEIKNILNTIGTPIILSNLSITKLSLRKEENIKEDQKQILNSIKNWKESWVSANYNEYINFYSPKAIYNNSEYRKWTRAKKNVFNKSKNIQISLNDISIYEYPSETEELRLVIFNQDYRSNLITNKTKKKQLWKVENEKWKIIYEGIE